MEAACFVEELRKREINFHTPWKVLSASNVDFLLKQFVPTHMAKNQDKCHLIKTLPPHPAVPFDAIPKTVHDALPPPLSWSGPYLNPAFKHYVPRFGTISSIIKLSIIENKLAIL